MLLLPSPLLERSACISTRSNYRLYGGMVTKDSAASRFTELSLD